MNMVSFALAAAISVAAIPAFAQNEGADAQAGAQALLGRFVDAWTKGDGQALASLFASDADFINPYGDLARGREEIGAFYSGVFKRGYGGSKADGALVSVRLLAADLAIIDGRWRIGAGRNSDGSARAEERGILSAVIGKSADGWLILALRENASAAEIKPIGAKSP